MGRKEIIARAGEIYAEDGAIISEIFEDEYGLMFSCEKDGLVDPTQPILVIEKDGREHYEAANGVSDFFFRYMDAKKVERG